MPHSVDVTRRMVGISIEKRFSTGILFLISVICGAFFCSERISTFCFVSRKLFGIYRVANIHPAVLVPKSIASLFHRPSHEINLNVSKVLQINADRWENLGCAVFSSCTLWLPPHINIILQDSCAFVPHRQCIYLCMVRMSVSLMVLNIFAGALAIIHFIWLIRCLFNL